MRAEYIKSNNPSAKSGHKTVQMNITTKQILQHFLSELVQELAEMPVHDHSFFFDDFFSREELRKMIEHLYQGAEKQLYDMDTISKSEMIDELSDADILEFFLDEWQQSQNLFDTREIDKLLEQLGLETHYLVTKDLKLWDQYDHLNYQMLLLKSGRIQKVYGIYDADISQEEVNTVTSPPKRFFDSQEQAKSYLHELLDDGRFHRQELHILYSYKTV